MIATDTTQFFCINLIAFIEGVRIACNIFCIPTFVCFSAALANLTFYIICCFAKRLKILKSLGFEIGYSIVIFSPIFMIDFDLCIFRFTIYSQHYAVFIFVVIFYIFSYRLIKTLVFIKTIETNSIYRWSWC